ncbi:MAG: translation initiation factor IF-2 [Gammaproteobacteria bacterium]|nr:translation initiation factor IF-2 [Gammaproteobacteria bacterium]
MAEVTVKQLASAVGTPVERLLDQIKEAGLKADSADALISDQDKLQLLDYLRGQHGKGAASGEEKPRKITLKRKSVTELKTSSGPGRGRTVAIEVRKKRTITKPGDVVEAPVVEAEVKAAVPKELEALEQLRADQARRELERDQEQEKIRARAEKRQQENEEYQAKIAAAKQQAEPEVEEKVELEAAEIVIETPKKAELKKEKPKKEKAKIILTPAEIQAEEARRDKGGKKAPKHEKTLYGRSELHVSTDQSGKRQKKKGKYQAQRVVAETRHGFEMPVEPVVHEVNVPEAITVDELAKRMSMKAAELIKALMKMGVMATINQIIDQDTAALVVEELGHKVVMINEDDRENELLARDVSQYEEHARAPVVTIMGHVDHGKTSLLDYIRTSKIANGEAGGITQHIGAYHVETDKGMITFLDTPGHAAFTSMRERGANATDIVILVVAADDGVMPQTIEAIQHAKAADVPIIVAVNKIDKMDADPERVRTELGNYSVIPEEWGGENVFVNVSAKTGQGVDDLLDAILLQAELMELKAHSEGLAIGVVLEASLDKGRGVTTTVLVQQGTLKKGDIILAGEEFGRVRAMFDEHGREVEKAQPSIPVAVIGLSKTPSAGDEVLAVEDERTAREVTTKRRQKARDLRLAGQQQAKLDSIFDQMKAGDVTKLNVLLKADVQGTLEAIRDALLKLTADNEEIDVAIVGSGVGGINETDISLAAASNAIVIGFNVRADATARASAAERGVDINYYSVIYELIDEVKKALIGMLKPEYREQITGLAKVQEVFRSQKLGQVAGSLVTEGSIKRSQPIRVLRDNVVIFEGELESLRRFKDDVEEVKSGTECGIAVKNYNDVKPGDQIEVFERILVERTL